MAMKCGDGQITGQRLSENDNVGKYEIGNECR